jgi:hypothetical protein
MKISYDEMLARFDEYLNNRYNLPSDALQALAENAYLQAFDDWVADQDTIRSDGDSFYDIDGDYDYDMER